MRGYAKNPFNAASSTTFTCYSANIPSCFPAAKIGYGNYIYAYSGVVNVGLHPTTGINYFGVSVITANIGYLSSIPGFSVQEAYNIDKKVDDGNPQSGNVTAVYLNNPLGPFQQWAAGGGVAGATPGTATTGSSTTCYDNGGNVSNPMQYSLEISNGSNVNCALSFQFQ